MILHAENVKKSFSQGDRKVDVLKGLNLEVTKGQTLAIIGQSGSGKSTLLSLLAGLDQPTSGKVSVDGNDLGSLNEEQLALYRGQKIGLVFQQFHLMKHLTALENVALPLEILKMENPRERAAACLEQLSLSHRLDHFPHQLSGGECQRVAIARAIAPKPSLLLADEPSGNLDSDTGDRVVSELFDLVAHNDMTMLVVTHSQLLADRCNSKLLLQDGVLKPVESRLEL